MVKKILLANRGEQPPSGAAAKSNCMACAGIPTLGADHV
jgi:hypothetical protein